MNKRTVKSWDDKIKKRQEGVAKERDKLDEALDELTALREHCDEAWEDLQRARDALSRFV